MRIALHTGKGGVGKTTMSAATAIAAAAAGHRTLLLSTDAAHSVGDVLGIEVGADPAPVPGVDGLWVAQVDTRDRFEQAWSDIRGYLVGVLSARGLAQVQAEELTVLPGADEIVALLEVHRYAGTGDFDVIIVDCAPSGESLRLLALPETVRFYSDRLMAAPARLMRTLATGFAGLTGARPSRDPGSAEEVSDATQRGGPVGFAVVSATKKGNVWMAHKNDGSKCCGPVASLKGFFIGWPTGQALPTGCFFDDAGYCFHLVVGQDMFH